MRSIAIRLFVILQTALVVLGDRIRREDTERGATAVEYGLLVALIAGVIILTVTALGGKLNGIFDTVKGALP